jgi:hypothetical protein
LATDLRIVLCDGLTGLAHAISVIRLALVHTAMDMDYEPLADT